MPSEREVVMPLLPPKRRKREPPSLKPISLVLLMAPNSVIWLSFQNRLTVNAPM